jgi:hypothetical protein
MFLLAARSEFRFLLPASAGSSVRFVCFADSGASALSLMVRTPKIEKH